MKQIIFGIILLFSLTASECKAQGNEIMPYTRHYAGKDTTFLYGKKPISIDIPEPYIKGEESGEDYHFAWLTFSKKGVVVLYRGLVEVHQFPDIPFHHQGKHISREGLLNSGYWREDIYNGFAICYYEVTDKDFFDALLNSVFYENDELSQPDSSLSNADKTK